MVRVEVGTQWGLPGGQALSFLVKIGRESKALKSHCSEHPRHAVPSGRLTREGLAFPCPEQHSLCSRTFWKMPAG